MFPADRPSSIRGVVTFGIFAAYVLIAIALTYPLIAQIGTGVPSDLGDPLLNTWILWWNAVNIPLTNAWWNAPAYYPTEGVLTFSEHLLGLSPISTPIYWLTGNIQLGYNVALLLSFPLSGFFGYLLCKDLTGRRDAAFIGGLIFGFTPYRIVQLAHIQVLCSYWMPITLLGLHRYARDQRVRWLVVFGGGWLMQALCNGYYLVFLSVLVGCWLLWFLPWRRWRLALNIALAWGIAAVPVVPIVLKYRAVHGFLGLRRSLDEILLFSADITSLLDHTNWLVVWRHVPGFHRPEGELFPGIAGIVLVGIGLWISRGHPSSSVAGALPAAAQRWSRLRIGLAVATVLFLASAVSAVVAPWAFAIGSLKISATRPHKPLSIAVVAALGLLFTSPRVRRSLQGRTVLGFYVLATGLMWLLTRPHKLLSRVLVVALGLLFTSPRVRRSLQGRTVLGFYVLATGLMWLFSFGPKPTFMGIQALYTSPYSWLPQLPGLDTLRAPARFHMAAMLCLSCAAALCFARIVAPLPRRRQIAFTTAIAVVAFADTWIWGFPMQPAPKPWPIQRQESPGPVLELPLGSAFNDVESMYRSMWTANPVVNGYSGFAPPSYGPVEMGLRVHDPALLEELSARGIRQLVVNMTAPQSKGWVQYFATRPDIAFVGTDGKHRLYRLPPSPPVADRPFGPPVRIVGITANVGFSKIPLMTDNDLTTRWETGPQRGVEECIIDLGGPTPVAAIVLAQGPFWMDAPRDLVIEFSDAGQVWAEVWHHGGARSALRAAFTDPVRMPATFDIGDRTTRYIRLRQLGKDEKMQWSVAELSVLSPPDR